MLFFVFSPYFCLLSIFCSSKNRVRNCLFPSLELNFNDEKNKKLKEKSCKHKHDTFDLGRKVQGKR